MASNFSFEDYLEIRRLTFKVAESYDEKNHEELKAVCAPKVAMDYRELRGELKDATPEQVAATIFDKKVIGDPRVKTQHLLGGHELKVLDDGSVWVNNQMRVAHQRHKTEDIMSEVVNKGHGIGYTAHTWKKLDGAWKLTGIKPKVLWFEYDLFGTLQPPEGEE